MRWLVLLIAMTLPIAAAAQPAPVPLGPTILDTGSQVVRVESFTLSAPGQGADYRIGVLIPRRPAPETGFPALYLLDGQAAAEGHGFQAHTSHQAVCRAPAGVQTLPS